MGEDEHEEDKKLHNSDKKLCDSYIISSGPTWVDYWSDGKVHTWESLQEDFIGDDLEELPRSEPLKDIDADLSILKKVRIEEECSVTIKAPRPGESKIVHISTVVDPSAPGRQSTPEEPLSFSKSELNRYVEQRKRIVGLGSCKY